MVAAGWKSKMLIRTRRYYTDAELVVLYKAHRLSYIEYRTLAIYHATRDILERLDRVQSRFLTDAGIDELEALIHFNLAPLMAGRDIAMLGLIHRTAIDRGQNTSSIISHWVHPVRLWIRGRQCEESA